MVAVKAAASRQSETADLPQFVANRRSSDMKCGGITAKAYARVLYTTRTEQWFLIKCNLSFLM